MQSAWQVAIAYQDNSLKVDRYDNVFCAGTKCGPQHSIIDAVVTGDLAGYNAVRCGLGQNLFELPKTLALGAFINHVGKMMRTEEGLKSSLFSLHSFNLRHNLKYNYLPQS